VNRLTFLCGTERKGNQSTSLTVLTSNPRKLSDNALLDSSDESEDAKRRALILIFQKIVVYALRTGKWLDSRSLACACPPKAFVQSEDHSRRHRFIVQVHSLFKRVVLSSFKLFQGWRCEHLLQRTEAGLMRHIRRTGSRHRDYREFSKSVTRTEGVKTQEPLTSQGRIIKVTSDGNIRFQEMAFMWHHSPRKTVFTGKPKTQEMQWWFISML